MIKQAREPGWALLCINQLLLDLGELKSARCQLERVRHSFASQSLWLGPAGAIYLWPAEVT